MAVELKIPTKKGLTLYTKNKYLEDDIDVTLDSSLIPQGTITITENGEYDVSNYETANVNTPVPTGTLEVTENGEHNVATYEKVNVNVAGESTLKKLLDETKSCYRLFYGYKGESAEDLIKYNDTENVTNMQQMFTSCKYLTTIPLLNTSNVTNMSYMVSESSIKTFPQLNTSKVTNMGNMFYACSNLTTIPQLDTSNVTNMSYMFQNCTNLTTIPQLDTSNVTNMNRMFIGCSSLTNIPQLNTSKVTDMNYMFSGCSLLKSIQMYGMKYNIQISYSTLFEASDLVTIISNCQVVTSSKTLTMGETNLAKLENVYVKETGVELYEGITCRPCVICESTDEGAMLVTTYATNKGWTLA